MPARQQPPGNPRFTAHLRNVILSPLPPTPSRRRKHLQLPHAVLKSKAQTAFTIDISTCNIATRLAYSLHLEGKFLARAISSIALRSIDVSIRRLLQFLSVCIFSCRERHLVQGNKRHRRITETRCGRSKGEKLKDSVACSVYSYPYSSCYYLSLSLYTNFILI
jgi:hypothetical protein